MTNAQFAKVDAYFKKACELAKIKVTSRQASKWFNGKGSAIAHKRMAVAMVNQERINETKV